MKKKIFTFLVIYLLSVSVVYGATILPGYSGGTGIGTATSGDVGSCLKVLGYTPTLTWTMGTCGSGGGGGSGAFSTTTSSVPTRLVVYPNNNTDIVNIGSNSTTTGKFWFDPNISQSFLSYASTTGITATRAWITTLANLLSAGFVKTDSSGNLSVDTNTYLQTVTADSPLSGSGTSGSHLVISTAGTWSGNAGTATALAANGGNCSSGNSPLGVDASGAVESCFDVWTEAENTSAGYVAGTRTLTIAGTANQITSSAGAQDLSSNRTWTLSIPSLFNIQNASTTGLSAGYGYFGTTATSSFSKTGVLTLAGLSTGCLTNTSGVVSSTGVACGSGSGGSFPFSADNNFNQVVYSTSTPTLWFKSGMYASSTSYFSGINISGNANPLLQVTSDDINAQPKVQLTNVLGHTWHFGPYSDEDTFTFARTGVRDYFEIENNTGLGIGNIIFDPGLNGTTTFANGNVGIGTSSPYAPLSVVGQIVAAYFTATTTATSTLPRLTSSAFAISGQSAGCAQFGAGGFLTSSGSACGSSSGLSSYDAWTHPYTLHSATTSTLILSGGAVVTASTTFTGVATTSFNGGMNVLIGDTQYGFATGAQPLEVSGSVNLPYQQIISNRSTGGNALSGYTLANANTTNTANPFADVYYSGMYMAGSGWNLYPGLSPNDMVVVNSDAQVAIASLSSTTGAINLAVNPGFTTANWDARLLGVPSNGTASWLVGTTTGLFPMTALSTTTSQFGLSNGAGIAQWTMRNAGGNLYIATTTVLGTATTSTSALTLNGTTGFMGLGTSSPDNSGDLLTIWSPSSTFSRMGLNNVNANAGTSFRYYNGSTLGGAIVFNNSTSQFEINGESTNSFETFKTAGLERLRITAGGFAAFGTTTVTNLATVTVASSTKPQLSLGDALAGDGQWVFRNAGGNLFFATTTAVGTATTSISAFNVTGSNGNFGIATDTPGTRLSVQGVANFHTATSTFQSTGGLNLNSGCYAIGTVCIGTTSGTVTSIANGTGLGGGTITTIGTISLLSYLATSSAETNGRLAYWTTTNGTPAKLGSVATTSETCTSPLSCGAFDVLTGGGAISLGTVPIANGGTATTTIGNTNGVFYSDGTRYQNTAQGAANSVLTANAGVPSFSAAPTIGTSVTTPLVIGGTAAGSSLTLQSSSGVGTTDAIIFKVGNNGAAEAARMTTGGMTAFGTTSVTNLATVTIASSTKPQLFLGDATAGVAQWTLRSSGTNLYFSTTTAVGNATTSSAALTLCGTSTCKPGLAISSSTPFATLSVNPLPGDFSAEFAVGSSSRSDFYINNSGQIFAPSTLSSGSSQTGYWCYDTSGQLIRDTAVCLVSARKFKTNIHPLDVGLNDLLTLTPVSYYKKVPLDASDSHKQMGFVADDVASLSPALNEMLVTYDSKGEVHGFRYEQFTALLTKSIQELNTKVENIQIGKVQKSAQDNWQWVVMFLMFCWIIRLEIKTRK